LFYRFRQRCVRWGFWVGLEEFSASSKLKCFDPGTVSHWSQLVNYLREGMVPQLARGTERAMSVGNGVEGVQVVASGAGNRKRLRKLPLESWVEGGFGPTEIFRFLRPFFDGLTWWQVYLQVREVRERVEAKRSVSPQSSGLARVLPSTGAGRVSESGERKSVVNGAAGLGGVGGKQEVVVFEDSVSRRLPAVTTAKRAKNGLLELFGPLPDVGGVDDFLFSAQGAKLRSGDFWRHAAEAAGAHFVGRVEFGGLKVSLDDTEDVGKLPSWCEEFALALTGALGFKEAPFAGALRGHPDRYESFHGWFVVMGHLFETIRAFATKAGRGALNNYFESSRVRIDLEGYSGGWEEFASVEEAFYGYSLRNCWRDLGAELLVTGLGIEWKTHHSKMYLEGDNISWRTRDSVELFCGYAQIVFASAPGTDLETQIKKQLFKPGLYRG
jgi:hypothetical protein